MGRATLLSRQPHRQIGGGAELVRRHRSAGSRDPRAHPGDGASGAPGHGQGHRGRARDGSIRAHFRHISRNGKLELEDDRGIIREGKAALHDLAEQWQHGGSFIDETSHRREAFNIMLSMPRGTDPLIVQRAAREFAHTELKGHHRYVMALHDDQANPHVHISVRAESRDGEQLNPRKPDLQRWRETFVAKLRA